jgi:hypothetical protein
VRILIGLRRATLVSVQAAAWMIKVAVFAELLSRDCSFSWRRVYFIYQFRPLVDAMIDRSQIISLSEEQAPNQRLETMHFHIICVSGEQRWFDRARTGSRANKH